VASLTFRNGRCAIYDDEFIELVRRFKWYFDRYAFTYWWQGGPKLYLHRFVMGEPAGKVDHINRNKLDCRLENLRVVTHSQNMRNRSVRSDSRSLYKGVSVKRGKWRTSYEASIYQDGRRLVLGRYMTERAAAWARDFAARHLEGELAWCNFPGESTPEGIQRKVTAKLAKHGYWKPPRTLFFQTEASC
jgi:hypothetical protein